MMTYRDYEESLKVYRDLNNVLRTSYDKGIKEGREEGLAEGEKIGMEKGRAEGRAEGERQKAVEMARKMKGDGLPVEVIVKYSGLNENEIERL